MNVLIVVPWDQERGGVASVVGSLARHLERRGYSVIFLHPGSERLRARKTLWGFRGYTLNMREPLAAGSRIRSLVAFLAFAPFVMWQLATLLRKHSIELVNVHYPGAGYFYLALFRLVRPVKLVVSVHGSELFPSGTPPRRYALPLRLLLRVADLVVAPSQAFARRVAACFPDLRHRLTWIHNGVELDDWMPRSADCDIRTRNRPYVLCVAMHQPHKRIDVLVKAFARSYAADRDLRLVLVGDGPVRGDLENLAVELGIRDRVEFLGCLQSQTALRGLLHDCSVFALPSSSESFGLATLEAMACGKPVVVSRVGGLEEIVQHGRNGMLVEPSDPDALSAALSHVLTNENLRRSLGANALLTVRTRFTAEAMVARYEAEFIRLTREPHDLAWKRAVHA